METDLNNLRDRAYKNACNHGFHDEEGSYRQQPPKSAPVPQQPNMFPPQQSNADGNDDLPF